MYKDILLAGTKRSGHHAIVVWLAEQLDETVRHHNDILFDFFIKGEVRCKSRFGDTYSGNGDKIHLYSMENVDISEIKSACNSELHDGLTIIVLRDIRNTLASEIKGCSPDKLMEHLELLTSTWKGYAYNYLNTHDECYVLFDKWFKDKRYRQKICSYLNIAFTDRGLNTVSNYGDGSSFDRTRFDGIAQKMDVLNRWQMFVNNRYYNRFFTKEFERLNKEIFEG